MQPAKTAGLLWINTTALPGLLHGKRSKPLMAWTCACLHLEVQPGNRTPGGRKAAASSHPCMELGKKITARHKVWQNSAITTDFLPKVFTESYLRCRSESTVLKDMGSCCMLWVTGMSQGEKYLKPHSLISMLQKLSTNRRLISLAFGKATGGQHAGTYFSLSWYGEICCTTP